MTTNVERLRRVRELAEELRKLGNGEDAEEPVEAKSERTYGAAKWTIEDALRYAGEPGSVFNDLACHVRDLLAERDYLRKQLAEAQAHLRVLLPKAPAAEPVAEQLHGPAYDAATGERIYVRSDEVTAERKPPFEWSESDRAKLVPEAKVTVHGVVSGEQYVCRVLGIEKGFSDWGDFVLFNADSRWSSSVISYCDPQSIVGPKKVGGE